MIGGEQIPGFVKGWAMDIWGHGKVHYWKRVSVVDVLSRCGIRKSAEWMDPNGKRHPRMHGGGDFPLCKRCKA